MMSKARTDVIEALSELTPAMLKVLQALWPDCRFVFGHLKKITGLSDRALWIALEKLKALGVIEVEIHEDIPRPLKIYKMNPIVARAIADLSGALFDRPIIPTGFIEETRRSVGVAVDVLRHAVRRDGRKIKPLKRFSPAESEAYFALFGLLYRFHVHLVTAYETGHVEECAEYVKRDFIEYVGEMLSAWKHGEDGRDAFEQVLKGELDRARGLLFAFVFVFRRFRQPIRDEFKRVLRVFRKPKKKVGGNGGRGD